MNDTTRAKELKHLQELERAERAEPNYPDDIGPAKVRFGTDPAPYWQRSIEEMDVNSDDAREPSQWVSPWETY
tara:strand:+ start:698 stop:916 length:219 start_codon:yes stop_codon:yes gene_type:complete